MSTPNNLESSENKANDEAAWTYVAHGLSLDEASKVLAGASASSAFRFSNSFSALADDDAELEEGEVLENESEIKSRDKDLGSSGNRIGGALSWWAASSLSSFAGKKKSTNHPNKDNIDQPQETAAAIESPAKEDEKGHCLKDTSSAKATRKEDDKLQPLRDSNERDDAGSTTATNSTSGEGGCMPGETKEKDTANNKNNSIHMPNEIEKKDASDSKNDSNLREQGGSLSIHMPDGIEKKDASGSKNDSNLREGGSLSIHMPDGIEKKDASCSKNDSNLREGGSLSIPMPDGIENMDPSNSKNDSNLREGGSFPIHMTGEMKKKDTANTKNNSSLDEGDSFPIHVTGEIEKKDTATTKNGSSLGEGGILPIPLLGKLQKKDTTNTKNDSTLGVGGSSPIALPGEGIVIDSSEKPRGKDTANVTSDSSLEEATAAESSVPNPTTSEQEAKTGDGEDKNNMKDKKKEGESEVGKPVEVDNEKPAQLSNKNMNNVASTASAPAEALGDATSSSSTETTDAAAKSSTFHARKIPAWKREEKATRQSTRIRKKGEEQEEASVVDAVVVEEATDEATDGESSVPVATPVKSNKKQRRTSTVTRKRLRMPLSTMQKRLQARKRKSREESSSDDSVDSFHGGMGVSKYAKKTRDTNEVQFMQQEEEQQQLHTTEHSNKRSNQTQNHNHPNATQHEQNMQNRTQPEAISAVQPKEEIGVSQQQQSLQKQPNNVTTEFSDMATFNPETSSPPTPLTQHDFHTPSVGKKRPYTPKKQVGAKATSSRQLKDEVTRKKVTQVVKHFEQVQNSSSYAESSQRTTLPRCDYFMVNIDDLKVNPGAHKEGCRKRPKPCVTILTPEDFDEYDKDAIAESLIAAAKEISGSKKKSKTRDILITSDGEAFIKNIYGKITTQYHKKRKPNANEHVKAIYEEGPVDV